MYVRDNAHLRVILYGHTGHNESLKVHSFLPPACYEVHYVTYTMVAKLASPSFADIIFYAMIAKTDLFLELLLSATH